jgi:hypothetical protein
MSLTRSPVVVRPKLRVAPNVRRNDAQEIIDLSASFGTELDPWQVDVLQAGCGVRPNGSWAAKTVGCNVSRQNGKSWILTARALAGAVLFGEKVVVISTHEQKTSRLLFTNICSYFEGFDVLRRRVKSIGKAIGREEIRLLDGTCIIFPARTRSALRGWSIDCYLADEAQLITDAQWEAMRPAMSARPNSVAWLFGTAPQLTTDAEVFGRLRRAAHEGTDRTLAWIEYGTGEGADPDDRDQWRRANPGRIRLEEMEAERRELSPGGFARERLNCWPTDRVETVIDPSEWARLVSAGPVDGTPPSAIGIDSSPDRAIAMAGAWLLEGGRVYVELLAAESIDPLDALGWVTQRADRRRIPVAIDLASPASAMISALTMAKVPTVSTSARELGRACAMFLDDVRAGRIGHAGQPMLDAAVAGARRRPIGDAGLWAWDRRSGSTFVAPLVACTLARLAATTVRPRSNRAVFF